MGKIADIRRQSVLSTVSTGSVDTVDDGFGGQIYQKDDVVMVKVKGLKAQMTGVVLAFDQLSDSYIVQYRNGHINKECLPSAMKLVRQGGGDEIKDNVVKTTKKKKKQKKKKKN